VVENKDDYLDLEEDYRDIHEFFSNQMPSWQQLQQALRHFEKNKQALGSDEVAKKPSLNYIVFRPLNRPMAC
jgi:hypothetical protein